MISHEVVFSVAGVATEVVVCFAGTNPDEQAWSSKHERVGTCRTPRELEGDRASTAFAVGALQGLCYVGLLLSHDYNCSVH